MLCLNQLTNSSLSGGGVVVAAAAKEIPGQA